MVYLFMRRMFKTYLFVIVFFLGVKIADAQLPADELNALKIKHPESSAVSTIRSEQVFITMKDDEPDVKTIHRREIMFLTEKGSEHGGVYVPSSSFFEASDLKATSLYPSGKKYKKISTTHYSVHDNLEGSIFHDDVVFYGINFPLVFEGAKGIIEYKEHVKEAHFFGSFFFDTPYMPTEKSVFEVTTPIGMEIDFHYFNVDSSKVNYTKKTVKDLVVHTWTMHNVPEVKMEGGTRGYKHHSPHMVARIKSITKNGKQESYLANVKDLHRWYYNFIRSVNKESSPFLDSLSIALTKNYSTDLEKIKSVFYWVQDNIKYVAFEDGLGGFVPRNAKDICSKRYGDCKDMTSIMHQMLTSVGVPVNMVWIGTTEIPYTYEQAPSPAADNHMILAYKNVDEWMFIDGTSTFNPLGMPSSFIQGKEALIHIDSLNFVVAKVPVMPATASITIDSVFMKIEGNHLVGTGKATYSGYYNQRINNIIEGKTDSEEMIFFDDALEKGSNKFVLKNYNILNRRDRDQPFQIDYIFTLNDYVSTSPDELFINMHLDKNYLKDKIDAKRKLEISSRFAFQHKWYYVIEIPEGYQVSFLPEATGFKEPNFSFEISYRKTEKSIIVEFLYVNDFMVIFPEQFEAWNNMVAKMSSTFKKSITLKKI